MIEDLNLDRVELRRKIRESKFIHFMISNKTYHLNLCLSNHETRSTNPGQSTNLFLPYVIVQ